jgi:hypothetical protein
VKLDRVLETCLYSTFGNALRGDLRTDAAFGLYFGTPVLSEEVFGALIVLHPRASSSWDYD